MASLNSTASLSSSPAQNAPSAERRGLFVDLEIVGPGNGPLIAPDVIAAIDVQHLPCNESSAVPGEQTDGVGDVLDLAEALHEVGLRHDLEGFGGVHVHAARRDDSRRHAVDADVKRSP